MNSNLVWILTIFSLSFTAWADTPLGWKKYPEQSKEIFPGETNFRLIRTQTDKKIHEDIEDPFILITKSEKKPISFKVYKCIPTYGVSPKDACSAMTNDIFYRDFVQNVETLSNDDSYLSTFQLLKNGAYTSGATSTVLKSVETIANGSQRLLVLFLMSLALEKGRLLIETPMYEEANSALKKLAQKVDPTKKTGFYFSFVSSPTIVNIMSDKITALEDKIEKNPHYGETSHGDDTVIYKNGRYMLAKDFQGEIENTSASIEP